MYLPLALRFLYRLVDDRISGNKRLMLHHGMHKLPYWASWWAAYTLNNFIISIICGTLAAERIFQRTSADALIAVLMLYGQALFGVVWVCASLFDNP